MKKEQIKEVLLQIYQKNKSLILMMSVLLATSLAFLIMSLVNLRISSTAVKVGYGDISGYQYGQWTNLLAFPVFSLILGLVHNFLAIRLYEKKGSGLAMALVICSIALCIVGMVMVSRLTGAA